MKILLYTTNPSWKSWDQKLSACRGAVGLVRGIKDVQIDLEVIPVVPRASQGKLDRAWYNTLTIKARKRGYTAVAVHMNVDYAKRLGITNYRGCAINDEAVGEIWIVSDEQQKITYKSGKTVNRFIKVFVHEMSHWMADFLKVEDKTHYWDYEQENMILALSGYAFPQGYMDKILSAFRSEKIIAPMENFSSLTVSQKFGEKNSLYKSGIHAGVDLAVPVGSKLRAPTDGRVTMVWKNDAQLGNAFVYEFFFNGVMYSVRCAHLKSPISKATFRRGDLIALSGNTGMSSGPHVHMELWRGGYDYDTLLNEKTIRENLLDPHVFFRVFG